MHSSSSSMQKTVLVLVGPTAVGKTELAIQLAEHFGTSVISADSRQCYRFLNIGVAKPSSLDLARVPHYFIDTHDIEADVNASVFEQYALDITEKLFAKHDVVIMAGGTGLYIDAFCNGLDELPTVPSSIRADIRAGYEAEGIAWLTERLKVKDPYYAEKGAMQNPQRMMRALEIVDATGKSILMFQKAKKVIRPFRIIKVGLDLPRALLYDRINQRVDYMMEVGLLEEVKSLQDYAHCNALQTVGYKELFAYLEGAVSLDEAVDQIKQHTRNYAKRQLTWFKKDASITWFSPNDSVQLLQWVEKEVDK